MNMDNYQIDEIVKKLHFQHPKPNHADELTDRIMLEIDRCAKRPPVVLKWVRIISTSAALLLTALFIQQQGVGITGQNKPSEPFASIKCIKIKPNECLNEKSQITSYLCYMRSNSIKNYTIYSKYKISNE